MPSDGAFEQIQARLVWGLDALKIRLTKNLDLVRDWNAAQLEAIGLDHEVRACRRHVSALPIHGNTPVPLDPVDGIGRDAEDDEVGIGNGRLFEQQCALIGAMARDGEVEGAHAGPCGARMGSLLRTRNGTRLGKIRCRTRKEWSCSHPPAERLPVAHRSQSLPDPPHARPYRSFRRSRQSGRSG